MLRICALSVPRFYDGGIEVGTGWTELPEKLTAEQRSALIDHTGRFIRFHEDDTKNLAALGLELVDGKLIEVNAKTNKKNAGKTGEKD